MIRYTVGNIFESNSEAIVNTVNLDGVMGKGIALQFKNQFPNNFKQYTKACKEHTIGIGKLLTVEDSSLLYGNKIIINFPTKTSWRKPSEYSYIKEGIQDLIKVIQQNKIKSISIPPLGAGNGGLEWVKVKEILNIELQNVECDIVVYEPNARIIEELKKERVKLTPARAMLLAVLFDLVRNGEFVSEFASEKISYFLQKLGAKEEFKLDFKQNFYGPYSGKVKRVLYYLNGSYIMGYSSMDSKPFAELSLVMDAEKEVLEYLEKSENSKYLEIVNKAKTFLSGFYSNFALELLSTVDFISTKINSSEEYLIRAELEKWSNRKKDLFSNPQFIAKALVRLAQL